MVSELIPEQEKRQALERVLSSRTFSRSDQLRSLLRYICVAELEGRAQELNEYTLGVLVLGRPSGYSPAEDSCVRSRAYELRNKLKSYYNLEAPQDPIQIEIRKGAYIPQFQRTAAALSAPPAPLPTTLAQDPPPLLPQTQSEIQTHRKISRPMVAALMIAAVAFWLIYRDAMRGNSTASAAESQHWTPEMAAFWKPFLNSSAPLIISFEIRLFFFSPETGLVLRDYQTNKVADLPDSKPLARFRERTGATDLRETLDYADFGSVHAAFLLGRLLNPQRGEAGLKHSGSLGWEDLWNSNVIFLGKPNLNPAIQYSLKSSDFAEDQLGVVRNLHPLPGEAPEYRSAETHGSGVKYAVISVMPGPQSGHRVMILSGSGSELMWAMAEFITSPTHVKEMNSHLRLPSGELPGAFQVLIEATFESNVPVKLRYVTHRASRAT